jgi:hypothetical protein
MIGAARAQMSELDITSTRIAGVVGGWMQREKNTLGPNGDREENRTRGAEKRTRRCFVEIKRIVAVSAGDMAFVENAAACS